MRCASPAEPADGWSAPLARLERVLAEHTGWRLRVCCPSQEFSSAEMTFGTGRWLSCSRGVWESLTVSADPRLVVIMLQAPRLGAGVLDYLFRLLPPQARASRQRHALVELDDQSPAHLSEKLLAHQALLTRLRQTLTTAREHGHQIEGLSCYAASAQMALLAKRLGVDLIDPAPRLLCWGTKSGSRQVFKDTNVPHPIGSYRADTDLEGLTATLRGLVAASGGGRWMIKADAGFGSGHGNAVIDVCDAPTPLTPAAVARALRPCTETITRTDYLDRVIPAGVVAEEFVGGGPFGFPSALGYLRRDPHGGVIADLLAVHDQVLGSGGDFIGCRFPADVRYRAPVTEAAAKVLSRLAAFGVTGHIGIDFIVSVPTGSATLGDAAGTPLGKAARLYATEINMRQTGTTHPHRMVRNVIYGTWNLDGTLTDQTGREICYAGTDGIVSPQYAGITSTQLIGELRRAPRLGFNYRTGSGVIPHLWSALERYGKVGATIIGRSLADCASLESGFITLLDRLADEARSWRNEAEADDRPEHRRIR